MHLNEGNEIAGKPLRFGSADSWSKRTRPRQTSVTTRIRNDFVEISPTRFEGERRRADGQAEPDVIAVMYEKHTPEVSVLLFQAKSVTITH